MKEKTIKDIPTQGVFGQFSNHVGHVAAFLDNEDSVASTTECTGLMPTPPTNEAEAHSYANLYDVPLQVNDIEGEKGSGRVWKQS